MFDFNENHIFFPYLSMYIVVESSDSLVVWPLDWQVKGLEFEPKARTSDFSKLWAY